jgi:uncharacterized protein (TIGR02099 family)
MDPSNSTQLAFVSASPRRIAWLAKSVRFLLWTVLALVLLVTVSWAIVIGLIVPRIEEFRPRLEIVATKVVGMRVSIGKISARSGGLIPSFELSDVLLVDTAGREALRLPRVLASLTPASLWGLGFEQLVLEQAQLDVRRTADGKVYVGGLDLSEGQGESGAATDWFFSQTEFAIRGGTLRWIDETRELPPLALTQVDAVLRNGRRNHQMRLDATPPPEWGDRFSLRGQFYRPLLSRKAGRWADWTGQVFADVSRIDISRLKQRVDLDNLGLGLDSGQGGLRLWADVAAGQLVSATVDAALSGVQIQLGKDLLPLALDSVSGRFVGKKSKASMSLQTEDLAFKTRGGLQWPGGNLSLVYAGAGSDAQQIDLTADRLDLAALAQLSESLPLGGKNRALIDSFAPKGRIDKVRVSWQGNADVTQRFSAKGNASALVLAAKANPLRSTGAVPHPLPGRPGIQGANVDFDVSQDGGKLSLSLVGGALDFPGVFEDSRVPFDRLSMDAQWRLVGGKAEVDLRNVKFSAPDAEGQFQASWRSPKTAAAHESMGQLDLQGSLSRGDAARAHRYLPLVLPDVVRHYVRDAVVKGDVSEVKFKVLGPIDFVPFVDASRGEFRISAKVKNGIFAYVPKSIQTDADLNAGIWPPLADFNAEVLFNRAALEINAASAKLAGASSLRLVKGNARIPDLMHSATVAVNLGVKGQVQDALAFVNSSPLSALTRRVLNQATASGAGELDLRLSLPLATIDKSRVQGTLTLANSDLQLMPAVPTLTRLKGQLTFTESGFNIPAAQARVLGGEIRFEGGSRPVARSGPGALEAEPAIAFRAQGTLSSDGLRQASALGFGARLAQHASGTATYTATLGFRRGVAEVMLASNLQGMALSLPAPLTKVAESQLPIRFENSLLRESLVPGQKLQDRLSLRVGNLVSVAYVRDVSADAARVLRGGIGVGLESGESMPEPVAGVGANINLDDLDLDQWEKVFAASAGVPLSAVVGVGVAIKGAANGVVSGAANNIAEGISTTNTANAAQAYLPTQMAIRAKALIVKGRQLNHVVVGGSREGFNWRANIAAEELNGYIEFRQPGANAPAAAGRLYARLSRLKLEQSSAKEVENILDQQPASLPSLDIIVDDFELKGRRLGRVEIEAINRNQLSAAGAREWRLNKLNLILPEATLTASGNWAALNAQANSLGARNGSDARRTVMNFRLDIADSGELLNRFGMPGLIRDGKGKMEGQVAWLGSPLSLDYPSMNGQFNVNVESGQFLKAEPGIAKLLGVLSLQSLPRRLTLDFRDVFSQGFAFDFVRGDINIKQGVAATNNLQMKGVSAAVLMEGSADIAKETQDIRVVVVPEINAGTASLIATAINPAIGLGTFLAQYFLRAPLTEAATKQFRIDGSWTDPHITPVAKKP